MSLSICKIVCESDLCEHHGDCIVHFNGKTGSGGDAYRPDLGFEDVGDHIEAVCLDYKNVECEDEAH